VDESGAVDAALAHPAPLVRRAQVGAGLGEDVVAGGLGPVAFEGTPGARVGPHPTRVGVSRLDARPAAPLLEHLHRLAT
jgi:hypothetical protein